MKSRIGRSIVWVLAVAATVVGLWLSWEMVTQHYKGASQQEGLLADICTAFEASSCEKISQSEWGKFPFGAVKGQPYIPTAELGLIYFSFVLSWLVLVGGATASRWWAHLIFFAGTLLGAGASGFFEYIMWFKLPQWCPLCLGIHVASFVLVICALLLWPRRLVASPVPVVVVPGTSDGSGSLFGSTPVTMPGPMVAGPTESRPWPTGWMLLVTPIVAILLSGAEHFYFQAMARQQRVEVAEKTTEYYKKQYDRYDSRWEHTYTAWKITPAVVIPIDDDPVRGPADAEHTIVIYSDFECPTCSKFETFLTERVLPLGQRQGTGGVKVVFKHWPINQACNKGAKHDLHPSACRAAAAAEAARVLGGDDAFWKMHDLLFEHQDEWKKSGDLVALAREIGLDEGAFTEAMVSEKVTGKIKASIAEGESLGKDLVEQGVISEANREELLKVTGTPAVFVDGKRLMSPRHLRTWWEVLSHPPANRRAGESSATTRPNAATRPAGEQE